VKINLLSKLGNAQDDPFDLASDLQKLIRQPSVSAKGEDLLRCADLVKGIMNEAGISTDLLFLKKRESERVPPVVYGEVKSRSNSNDKTILFYNHYDVQPVEPSDLWESDPFSGKIIKNRIFGRGSSDDKGELVARIKAVEYLLKTTGDVPCNIKFLVEGEEEIGSPHISEYLTDYKEKFLCDGVIWEYGYSDDGDKTFIELGLKGILSVELSFEGPQEDVHSSLAVVIENPAWKLISALNSMRTPDGKILIENWHDEVREFTVEELNCIAKEPLDIENLKRGYGIRSVKGESSEKVKKALAGDPTCNIAGLNSGHIGKGIRNIVPARAVAKVDFRLVPEMMPEKQFDRLKVHLKQHGFSDVNVRFLDGEPPARTPINHPFVKLIEEVAREMFKTPIVRVSSAGTGPMYYFHKILKAPCVCVGGTYTNSKIHSANEFARMDLLSKATEFLILIMKRFGANEEKNNILLHNK
jgi:acetylornithine deacetylase/succinyl-diaminopimelate desuccinylase-like protein